MSEVPASWASCQVRDVLASDPRAILTGPFGATLGKADFRETGVPLLTIGALGQGQIRNDKILFVAEEKAEELADYRLQFNDILFSRMGTVGRCSVINDDHKGSLFNYHIIRLRVNHAATTPYFLKYYFQGAEQVGSYLREVNRGVTRAGVNTSLLAEMPLSLPPLAEQRRIVAKLDRLFARTARARAELDKAAKLGSTASANGSLIDRLDAQLLAKAFRGELVPQDPDDEPAAVLLDRIRAERAATPKPRGGRRGAKDRAASAS